MRRRDLEVDPGRFIALYGPSASGKFTLARRLGVRLGLPVLDLDWVYYGQSWEPPDTATFRARLQELLDAHPEGWVIEPIYRDAQDLVLDRANTVIWLRLPFRVVYPRLVRRTVASVFQREELPHGNRETVRSLVTSHPILWWGIRHWKPHIANARALVREARSRSHVVVLRTPREVREWLGATTPAAPPPGPSAS